MFTKIKKLLGFNIVEWVENTAVDSHLEAREYLFVYSNDEGPLLFSPSQVKIAKKRAKEQPEDV